MMFEYLFWPLGLAFVGLGVFVALIFFAFWIWMIVDCARRDFIKDVEKIVWLLVIVFGGWVGALVYFIVIFNINKKGLMKK